MSGVSLGPHDPQSMSTFKDHRGSWKELVSLKLSATFVTKSFMWGEFYIFIIFSNELMSQEFLKKSLIYPDSLRLYISGTESLKCWVTLFKNKMIQFPSGRNPAFVFNPTHILYITLNECFINNWKCKVHPIYGTTYIKIFTDSRGYVFAILRLEKIWVPGKFSKSFRMGWAPSSSVTAHILNSNLLLRLSCFAVACKVNLMKRGSCTVSFCVWLGFYSESLASTL